MAKKLWARIGMICEVTDEEYEELKDLMKKAPGDAATMLDELFRKRGEEDGDSYLVADCEDNPNIYDVFDF